MYNGRWSACGFHEVLYPCRQAIPKSFVFFRENFLLLVCELFRAHEMRSQLEVTEMLECKVNLTV